jgi:hypothetical protein
MSSKIQAVLFDKNVYSISKALKWLKKHGFNPFKVDITLNLLRFRMIDPNKLKNEGYSIFRNKKINEDISYIIAYKN